MSISTIAYTLMTISTAGVASYSPPFAHREQCEDAKSFALSGLSVSDKKIRDDTDAKTFAETLLQWSKDNPPRPPADDYERGMVNWSKSGGGQPGNWPRHVCDGMICDDPPYIFSHTFPLAASPIKVAECLPVTTP
jgi:hypothetical protein